MYVHVQNVQSDNHKERFFQINVKFQKSKYNILFQKKHCFIDYSTSFVFKIIQATFFFILTYFCLILTEAFGLFYHAKVHS